MGDLQSWDPVQGLPRRKFIKVASMAVSTPFLASFLAACARAAQEETAGEIEVVYDGEVFDAGGATLNVGNWGGIWEETQRKASVNQFEQDFNCQIAYDNAAPYYPKLAVAGVDNPPLDVYSWDQDSDYLNAPFVVSQDAIRANCPNAAELWEFAWQGTGATWAFSETGHAVRSDLVDPPAVGFKSIFEDRFAGLRGWYDPQNGVGLRLFLVAAEGFGTGPTDEAAAFGAIEAAAPWKIVDFTGTMQSLLEQGEVTIAVQHDAEVWDMQERGLSIDFVPWDDVTRVLLPQQFGVARGSKNKPLAYAYLNRVMSPEVQRVWAEDLFMRPSNKNTEIPDNLASHGIQNTADGTAGLDGLPEGWRWWFENQERFVEQLNAIIGA
jgi:putative spermidine/putrescine transport system substrate-binding protein